MSAPEETRVADPSSPFPSSGLGLILGVLLLQGRQAPSAPSQQICVCEGQTPLPAPTPVEEIAWESLVGPWREEARSECLSAPGKHVWTFMSFLVQRLRSPPVSLTESLG